MAQIDEFVKNIKELETKVAESGIMSFNIEDYFASDDDIIKNIIKFRNPGIEKWQLDMMVDDEFIEKIDIDVNAETDPIRKETLIEKVRELQENIDIRKAMRERAEELGIYPVKEKYQLEKEKLKSEIKNAASMLKKEMESFIKMVVNSTMGISTAIAGIPIMIAAPPWNVPAALSLLSTILDMYFALVDKIKTVISFISPLKDIHYVVSSDKFNSVLSIVNTFLRIILGFWDPINLLNDIISALIEFLKNLFGGDDNEKMIRRASRRLRKLGYLPKKLNYGEKGSNVKDEEDQEEIDQILETFKVVYPWSRTKAVVLREMKDKDGNDVKYEDLIDNMISGLSKLPEISDIKSSLPKVVYDVKLPNGIILYGLNEEELDDIKDVYEVVFTNKL